MSQPLGDRASAVPSGCRKCFPFADKESKNKPMTLFLNTMIDRTKTLAEIDNNDWGPPNFPSYLVTTCHRLRHKPLLDFTVEDLRILLGQGHSAEHLVPLALEELERDPLVEGDFYPGDLLYSVLTLERGYFESHPEQATRLRSIYERAREALLENEYSTAKFDSAAQKHWG